MAFSYNASQMECGIRYAKMLDGNGVNSIIRSINMPSGFSGSTLLNKALNSIGEKGINEKIICLSNNLSNMKAQMEKMMSEENRDVVDFMLDNRGQVIELDSDTKKFLGLKNDGTIIIPEDWTPYDEFGLLVNFPGYIIWSEKHASSDAREYPFLQDVYKGKYRPKGVIIYTPTGWGEKDGKTKYKNLGIIQGNIENLVAKLNIDKDRVSLTGYSIGGYAVAKLVESNPDYYSSVAICGAAFHTATDTGYKLDVDKVIRENPNTTFIWYVGSNDYGYNNYPRECAEYQKMKDAGLNTVLYVIDGGQHDLTCWNYLGAPLINDMTYIKKGEKYSIPDGPLHITLEQLKTTKFSENNEDTYYMLLSSGNNRDRFNGTGARELVTNINAPTATYNTDLAIYSDTSYVVESDVNHMQVVDGRVTLANGQEVIGYSQYGAYIDGVWHQDFWDNKARERYNHVWTSVAGGNFSSGCYALSITNAVANLVDPSIDPAAMGEIIGDGTNGGAIGVRNAAEHYGLNYAVTKQGDYTYTLSNSNVDQFLQNGGKLICAVNGGGHYISIVGMDANGNYIVCDSYQKHPITVVENKGDIVKSLSALGDGMKSASGGSLTYFIAPKGYTVDQALNTELPTQAALPQQVINSGTATTTSSNSTVPKTVTDTATAASVGVAASNVVKPSSPAIGGGAVSYDNTYVNTDNTDGKYISYNGMWYSEEEYAAILASQNQQTTPSNHYEEVPNYTPYTPSTPVTPDKPEEVTPVTPDKPEEVTPVTPEKPEEVTPVIPDKPEEVTPVAPEKPEEGTPVTPEKPEKVTPVTPRPRPSRPSVIPDISEEMPEDTNNPQTIDEIYEKALKDLESYEPKTDFDVNDTYTDVPYNSPLFEFDDNTNTNVEPEITPIEPEPVIPVVIPEVEPIHVEEPDSNVGKVIGGIAATAGVVGAGIAAKKMYDKTKEKEYNDEYVEDDYNYDTEEDMSNDNYNYNNGDIYKTISNDDYLKEEEKEEETQYDENGFPIQKESIVPDEDDY